jgi:hypothetical protein
MESSPEERHIYLEKLLAEKSADPFPSVRDLRASLLSLLDVAEELARNRPEYAAAVISFSQEIRRIKKELMSSFEVDLARHELEILTKLTQAQVIAQLMEESHPEKRGLLTKIQKDLGRAWGELSRTVRPDVERQA